jgi:hypothetical protein
MTTDPPHSPPASRVRARCGRATLQHFGMKEIFSAVHTHKSRWHQGRLRVRPYHAPMTITRDADGKVIREKLDEEDSEEAWKEHSCKVCTPDLCKGIAPPSSIQPRAGHGAQHTRRDAERVLCAPHAMRRRDPGRVHSIGPVRSRLLHRRLPQRLLPFGSAIQVHPHTRTRTTAHACLTITLFSRDDHVLLRKDFSLHKRLQAGPKEGDPTITAHLHLWERAEDVFSIFKTHIPSYSSSSSSLS